LHPADEPAQTDQAKEDKRLLEKDEYLIRVGQAVKMGRETAEGCDDKESDYRQQKRGPGPQSRQQGSPAGGENSINEQKNISNQGDK